MARNSTKRKATEENNKVSPNSQKENKMPKTDDSDDLLTERNRYYEECSKILKDNKEESIS